MMRGIKYYYSRFGITGLISAVKKRLGRSDVYIKVKRKGIKKPFYLRLGTSDTLIFDQVFVYEEYDFETSTPPKVIIDAGAHIGLASIYFANKYPESKIVAIEPEESNFKLLKINVGPYTNVIPLQAALWCKNEEISLVDPGQGTSGFMTEEDGNKERYGNFRHHIQGKTVDRIMQDYDLQRIDILKIDIEGAEREVFSDTSSWIGKVDGIIIELHERLKSGCDRSFYNGTTGFDDKWLQGENVFLSKRNRLTRRSA
jgi:FkbM family methyltransferase